MIIYKSTNLINNKVYIGQTIHKLNYRKARHIRDSRKETKNYFHNAINKYGSENFKWEIICECETLEELNEKEILYIQKYNSTEKKYGYNIAYGGHDRKNLIGPGNGMYNKKHSAESKRKMSETKKLLGSSTGKNNSQYGIKKSENSKKLQSEKMKGKPAWNKNLDITDERIKQASLKRKETINKNPDKYLGRNASRFKQLPEDKLIELFNLKTSICQIAEYFSVSRRLIRDRRKLLESENKI